jgi:hypothetical protein
MWGMDFKFDLETLINPNKKIPLLNGNAILEV